MANTHSLDLEATSSQYASIADASQTGLDLSGDFTIEGWIKIENAPSNSSQFIVTKWDYGTPDYLSYALYYNDTSGTKTITIEITQDGTSATRDRVSWTQTLTPGIWYHIAATCDISNAVATEFELYVNGKSVGNGSVVDSYNASSIYNGAARFSLSAQFSDDTPDSFFDGKLDNMRVWSDVRTASEIETNFQKETPADTTNLVGHWKLNNDYTDASGNGNTLTASGSPVFATDPAFTEEETYSISLVQASSQHLYITDANQVGLDILGDITIAAWIKLTDVDDTYDIVSKYSASNSHQGYVFKYYGPDNQLIFQHSNNGTTDEQNVVTQALSADTWYHVAVTWDASESRAKFYLNGSQIGTDQVGSQTSIFNSSANFAIGAIYVSFSPTQFYNGLIDEVQVFNVVRTGTEIANAMNDIIDPDTTGLQGYWRFENNFADLTDNNNWLTPGNSPVFSTDVPVFGSPSSSVSPSVSPSISPSSSTSPSSSISPSASNSPSASISLSPSASYRMYTKGDEETLPIGTDDLETYYTEQEEINVENSDNLRVPQTGAEQYMLHSFKNFVEQAPSCTVIWEGRSTLAPSVSPVYLQVYNHNTDEWETIDSNNTAPDDTDFELRDTINDMDDYRNENQLIFCRVYQLAI